MTTRIQNNLTLSQEAWNKLDRISECRLDGKHKRGIMLFLLIEEEYKRLVALGKLKLPDKAQ